MKGDRLYLVYVIECIERIERYVADGQQAFLEDTRTQDAVLRNLHTLTELIQRVSDEVQVAYPQVDWRNIGAFRNVVVHDYLGIDLDQVWDIVENNLPGLKDHLKVILKDLDQD